jgi:predicted MFS family arabinose efflux permease
MASILSLSDRMTRPAPLAAAVLAVGPAIGVGIGRFAYSLLLPAMRDDLHWSYAQAGALNTWNAIGYVAASLIAARTIAQLGARRALIASALASVALIAATGATSDFATLNVIRFLLGVAGAFAFVGGGALVAALPVEASSGMGRHCGALLLGLFFAGPGFGVMLSGTAAPMVLAETGSWRLSWLALAVIAAMLYAAAHVIGVADPAVAGHGSRRQPAPILRLLPVLLANVLYGAGMLGFMTFMIAFVRDGGHGALVQALFWILAGGTGIAATWLWPGMIGRARGGWAMAALAMVLAAGAILPLVSTTLPVLFASAVVFGSGFFAVVTAIASYMRANVTPQALPAAFGAATAAAGIGQIIGPLLVGAVTDRFGGLASGLWLAVALLVLAAVAAALQRDLKPV